MFKNLKLLILQRFPKKGVKGCRLPHDCTIPVCITDKDKKYARLKQICGFKMMFNFTSKSSRNCVVLRKENPEKGTKIGLTYLIVSIGFSFALILLVSTDIDGHS